MRPIRYLDPGQRESYLAHMPARFRMAAEVLVISGLRLDEVEGVRVRHMRLRGGVNKILLGDERAPTGNRSVFVPTGLARRITAFVEERGLQPNDHVFTYCPGWSRKLLERAHRVAAVKAGAPDYTLEDHRHTAAVNLASVGCPLQLIRKQLGHETIQETMIYAEFHPDYADVKEYFVGRAPNEEEGSGG